MHSRSRRAGVVIATLALITSSACVSKGRYDRLVTQRDEASQSIAALESKNADLSQKLSATESKVSKMRGTYDQLVSELESEVAAGQVQIQKIVDGIRLNVSDSLLFPSGSAALDAEGRDVLRRVAEQIKAERALISVVGHTDNVMISASLRTRYPSKWELSGARAASAFSHSMRTRSGATLANVAKEGRKAAAVA